jgi:hypothetical protein
MRAVDTIISSIKTEPEKWKIDRYRMVHNNGVSIWIANGIFFYSIEGLPQVFSFWDKIKLHITLSSKDNCFQRKIIERFKEAPMDYKQCGVEHPKADWLESKEKTNALPMYAADNPIDLKKEGFPAVGRPWNDG